MFGINDGVKIKKEAREGLEIVAVDGIVALIIA